MLLHFERDLIGSAIRNVGGTPISILVRSPSTKERSAAAAEDVFAALAALLAREIYNSSSVRARRTASRRFFASSLRYTARWWVLTVVIETYNSEAISLLERLLAR